MWPGLWCLTTRRRRRRDERRGGGGEAEEEKGDVKEGKKCSMSGSFFKFFCFYSFSPSQRSLPNPQSLFFFTFDGPEHDGRGPPADPARRDHEREPLPRWPSGASLLP